MGWIDGHELSFRQDSNGHTQWMHIIVFGLTELWRAQEKKIERRRKKERIFNYWLWMENEWMNELMIFCGWNGIICQAQPAGSNFLSPALTFFFLFSFILPPLSLLLKSFHFLFSISFIYQNIWRNKQYISCPFPYISILLPPIIMDYQTGGRGCFNCELVLHL